MSCSQLVMISYCKASFMNDNPVHSLAWPWHKYLVLYWVCHLMSSLCFCHFVEQSICSTNISIITFSPILFYKYFFNVILSMCLQFRLIFKNLVFILKHVHISIHVGFFYFFIKIMLPSAFHFILQHICVTIFFYCNIYILKSKWIVCTFIFYLFIIFIMLYIFHI